MTTDHAAPGVAVRTSVVVAVLYVTVLIAIQLGIRATVSPDVRNTDAFKFTLFFGSQYAAVLLQLLVATVVAARQPHLRVEHALFAAFVAGNLMVAGNVLTLVLFGSTLDLKLAGSIYANFVNTGAAIALVGALVTVALTRRTSPTHIALAPISS